MLEHVLLPYSSDEDLATRAARSALEGLGRDEAVLVCLPPRQWELIAGELGAGRQDVRYLPAGDRYARPVRAMAVLAEHLDRELAAGATAVRSIGELPLTGGPGDAEWYRYDAAVNDVFADVALHAVCTVNSSTTPPGSLEQLLRLHPHVEVDGVHHPSPTYDPHGACRQLVPPRLEPDRPPDLDSGPIGPGDARRLVSLAVGDELGDERLGELHLVVTELLVNAVRHGGGEGCLQLWRSPGSVVVTVTDPGPGPSDPYAGLRPPGTTPGGRGLWIAGHLGDAVAIGRSGGRSAVTVRLLDDP